MNYTKNLSLLLFGLLLLCNSCIKDRVLDHAVNQGGSIDPGDRELIHYWNFNSGDLLIPAYTIGGGMILTSDTYDDVEGTTMNIRIDSIAKDGLRMRNPSTNIIIKAPTRGYSSPLLSFAVMRTNNGAVENIIDYTLDGTNFTTSGLSGNVLGITEEWKVYSVDFHGIPGVDDNEHFAIRITFNIGNTNTSGNDRYDNICIDASKN